MSDIEVIKNTEEEVDQTEYWTSEHADAFEAQIDEVQRISNMLDRIHEEHERGGLYYNTTKKLLEAYRPLRFDIVNEKMMKTVESSDVFNRNKDFGMVTLDNILSMPDIYKYYTTELNSFVSSSIPVTMGLFVHLVDAGIRIMTLAEKDTDFKYSELLKAVYVDAEKTPQELFEMFGTNRSTFYRKRDEAITALSIIIFGPLGGRHPTTLFDDNTLKKKYGRFLKIADQMDEICGLMDVHEEFN